jgi:drug/metabolite transporter (DMT)-like permease
VIGAGVCFGLHQLVYVPAAILTSIAIVTAVAALQPLLVAVLSRRVVGERVPPALGLWSVLAVLAVFLVMSGSWDDQSRSLAGDLLSGLNLCVFTGYFLLAKRARDQGTPTLTLTLLVAVIALLVVTTFSVAAAPFSAVAALELPRFGWQWLLLALLAVGPANGHLLLNWAHPRVTAAFASLVLSSVPLLSSIWAHLVFGEPYGARHVAGMLLAACAIEGGRRAEQRLRASRAPA